MAQIISSYYVFMHGSAELENNVPTAKKIILYVSLVRKCFCCSIFNYQDMVGYYLSAQYAHIVVNFMSKDLWNLSSKRTLGEKTHYSSHVASKNCELLNCLCSTWLPQVQILVHSREPTLWPLLAKPCDLWPMNWRQLSRGFLWTYFGLLEILTVWNQTKQGGGGGAPSPPTPPLTRTRPANYSRLALSFLSKTALFYTCCIWI